VSGLARPSRIGSALFNQSVKRIGHAPIKWCVCHLEVVEHLEDVVPPSWRIGKLQEILSNYVAGPIRFK